MTGGAGYIGSHTIRELLLRDFVPVVLDNFSTGSRSLLSDKCVVVEGNAGNQDLVRELLSKYHINSIIHFAGSPDVELSVREPLQFYENNAGVSRRLIQVAVEGGVEYFIFSSTAAVYGQSAEPLVNESTPVSPISPYGRSKLATEWVLGDVAAVTPLKFAILRYFNVAGARVDGTLGQMSPRATHLIKVAAEAACGLRDRVEVFGTDYPTSDGTGVRDYIHVDDLARAHIDALNYLNRGGLSDIFNVGYGKGISVREVLKAMMEVSGQSFSVVDKGRRAGDCASLSTSCEKIKRVLDWKPQCDSLRMICESAYRWEQKQNNLAESIPTKSRPLSVPSYS